MAIAEELSPVWNEDCTFTWEEGDEEVLTLRVFDKGEND